MQRHIQLCLYGEHFKTHRMSRASTLGYNLDCTTHQHGYRTHRGGFGKYHQRKTLGSKVTHPVPGADQNQRSRCSSHSPSRQQRPTSPFRLYPSCCDSCAPSGGTNINYAIKPCAYEQLKKNDPIKRTDGNLQIRVVVLMYTLALYC